jgi:tRNA-splicing ligase RtcB (3'-phosphate/5'-hydroxy nucleic acid ligase)
MQTVIYDKETQKVPVKIWAPEAEVETSAIQQLKNISTLPFVFKHVAAMPDVHLGIGATVGSVIATKGAIIPAAVGVDLGCGMMAVKTDLNADLVQEKVKQIRHSIERSVPVGHNSNRQLTKTAEAWSGWQNWKNLAATQTHRKGIASLQATAMSQLGSLGGGNHFIELCLDTDNNVWIMLHSGSRNIGKSLAEIHITKAKGIMKQMFISLPDPDLAYYAEGTKDYDEYMYDIMWAQEYALANREEMMTKILKDISFAVGMGGVPFGISMMVNCHHNYASRENHYGENVIVTRKGAVRARGGDLGIIPGSMGTRSYIVRGLGSDESFHSCSHGAGRRMSRTEARKQFNLEDLAQQTSGVDCRKDDGVLDEIPAAYKDIDQVMDNQKDLVEIVAQLKQFMCIKG